jgi:hypothetical protein
MSLGRKVRAGEKASSGAADKIAEQRAADAVKTARLRALRLDKEAADRSAEAAAAQTKPSARGRGQPGTAA